MRKRTAVISLCACASMAGALMLVGPAVGVASVLTDGRAYELVSPPSKNGGDVAVLAPRTRAASDGNAATFVSLSGFGDVVGTGVGTEYMSARSTNPDPGSNGWVTHAITPPQDPLGFPAAAAGLEPLYEGGFSSDLSIGAFRSWSPVTDAPNVANVPDLYVRRDLHSAGPGTYELASDCPGCAAPLPPLSFDPFNLTVDRIPWFAGASKDFSHVLFESSQNLTADASGTAEKLYEADHGTVRLAGVLPDGTAAASSVAGWGAAAQLYTPHVISADGSRVLFTADPAPCGTVENCGALYMRVDHTTTIELNASERTDCADHDPCSGTPEPDPNGVQPASYGDASADGSRVFFMSKEALTDDPQQQTLGPNALKLYMYDASKSDSDPHNLTFISADNNLTDGLDAVSHVIGASDDGRYVYFTAGGQLVAGAPAFSGQGLFLWHDGTTRYIGALSNIGDVVFAAVVGGHWGPANTKTSHVTPDGRHLLFSSTAEIGPTGIDQGTCGSASDSGCREFYLYSADTGSLTCVSCAPSGAVPTSNVTDRAIVNAGVTVATWHTSRAVSDDGSRAFFSTADALVPDDTNGVSDAYEWEADGAGDCHRVGGCIALLSSGKDPDGSYFMDASANGDDAFFITRARLVGWDRDNSFDLYDARVHGGFPEPRVVAECSGDACQGNLAAPPGASLAGSLGFVGSGNVHHPAKPRHVRCRRAFVRKRVHGKVRCVRKHRAHRGRLAGMRHPQQRGTR